MSAEDPNWYKGSPTFVPRCVRLKKIDEARVKNDEVIINQITTEIPTGNIKKHEKITALLSYIALGGSILSLGGIFYLYFNGEPIPPEECMNDSTYNTIIETCNKIFATYWQNQDKSSCEIEIDNFNAATETYNTTLGMLTKSLVVSSLFAGANKIAQVSKWVKKRFSESMCAVQGGRRRYRKKGKSRRCTKKIKTRRRVTKKIKTRRRATKKRMNRK